MALQSATDGPDDSKSKSKDQEGRFLLYRVAYIEKKK